MDNIKNLAYGTLAAGVDATQLELQLASGLGSRFPAAPFNFIVYPASAGSAALARPSNESGGKAAIYRCLINDGDVLTCQGDGSGNRLGQEGTPAIAHNDTGETYIVKQIVSKIIFD